jgi:predicted Fe-Mo cluster-binding NifX family protein
MLKEVFMKTIAVSTARKSLDAPVGALFGRARFFILADPGNLEWEVLDNLPNLSVNQLIGITTARNLVQRNIKTVITGKCGSKAFGELTASGVQVILNTKGTVRQVLAKFLRGDFSLATGPNVSESRAVGGSQRRNWC